MKLWSFPAHCLVSFVQAFTIFCGLGINNTLTYGELEMAIARQKVAIEVRSLFEVTGFFFSILICTKFIPF